jgi:hypothetical protein
VGNLTGALEDIMKKLIFLLLLLLILTTWTFAGKIAVFPAHVTADTIRVDNEYIYITEGSGVFIYSMKDFKLIKKFGRKGEGPKEFKGKPELNVQKDFILVNSTARVSFFSKNGTYIREVNNIVTGRAFQILGNGYAGYKMLVDKDGTRYSTINIYDAEFRKTKEVYRHESIVQEGKGWKLFGRTYLKPLVCDNKIVVAGEVDFIIHVFDDKGEKLFTIDREYRRVKFTEEHRNNVLYLYKTRPTTAPEYDWWKKNIRFPDYFPAIRTIYTADKKIYVRTYREKESKSEFFIFDANGKFVKHVFLPIAESSAKNAYPYMRDFSPFTIKDDNLYQLILDEETEEWALYVHEI